MMITIEGKYQTRDGRAVRILCVDGPASRRPIIGLIDECSAVLLWSSDGYACPDGPDQDWDLVPVPTKHEGWVPLLTAENSDVPRIDGVVNAGKAKIESFCERYHAYTLAHVTWEN